MIWTALNESIFYFCLLVGYFCVNNTLANKVFTMLKEKRLAKAIFGYFLTLIFGAIVFRIYYFKQKNLSENNKSIISFFCFSHFFLGFFLNPYLYFSRFVGVQDALLLPLAAILIFIIFSYLLRNFVDEFF